MEIIVLKNTDYKEKDVIIEGLSSEGVQSFLVRGMKNPTCSNIALSNNLVLADVELTEGKYKYPVIKKSKIISSPYHLDDDINQLGIISLLDEITLNLLQEEERLSMFNSLRESIIHLQNHTVDAKSVALIYLMRALKEAGASFEVRECVNCGSKSNIVAFSFFDGGFICKNCLQEDTDLSLKPNDMLSIRSAVLLEEMKTIPTLTEEGFKNILNQIKIFALEFLGVKLTSIDLIA